MVFYRKYRPQKISELDSEQVRNSLLTLISSKEIPHALLFTGPKGLGKTSAARIVAKIINCEVPRVPKVSRVARGEKARGTRGTHDTRDALSTIEPCNKCSQCVSITKGTNLDVLEIDAASNRGIDEIRDLREKIALVPSGAEKKIYIIDEVHMLTTEAFNALLKMLEEPPNHAMFILCTTEAQKVPETIRSRCFRVAFKRASEAELMRSLKRIVVAEKIAIDKEAMGEIAKSSDGSFRDASKYLEQAKAHAGKKKIIREHMLTLFGKSQNGLNVLILLKEKNLKDSLLSLNDAVEEGLNVKTWLEDSIAMLHSTLLQKYNIHSDEVDTRLTTLTEEELKRIIQLFMRAHQELKTAVIPQLPVEIAIIEYCIDKEVSE